MAEAPQRTLADVTAGIDAKLQNRVLSADEVAGLKADLRLLSPEDQAKALAHLTGELKTRHQSGQPVRIQDATLAELKALPGVDAKVLADIDGARDRTVQREVTQGLEKTATQVDGKTASDTRDLITRNVKASHDGAAVAKNELTPEFKLAQEVGKHVWGKADAKLDQHLSGGMKAAKDAVAPQVGSMVNNTLGELAKNPAAVQSAQGVFDAFMTSNGIAAMNPEAVAGALQVLSKMGPKYAEAATKVGAKLGVSFAAKEGVKVGAEVGVKAAATGGKALPVIGNAIAVGSSLWAGAHLVKQLFERPVSAEKITKELVNTAAQVGGIFFPWIALGGDLVNAGWSMKLHHDDAKKAANGEAVTPNADLKDVLPFASGGAEAMLAALSGAMKTEGLDPSVKERLEATQAKVKAFHGKIAQLEQRGGTSSAELAELKKTESEMLMSLGDMTKAGLEDAAKHAPTPNDQATLNRAATIAGNLGTVLHKNRVLEKNAAMSEMKPADVETKRKANAGELIGVVKDAAGLAAEVLAEKNGAKT